MQVDETGGHEPAVGVDGGARPGGATLADLGDPVAVDGDVGRDRGAPVPSTTVPLVMTRSCAIP